MTQPISNPKLLPVGDINNLIELLIGDDALLRASERDGKIYLRYLEEETYKEIKLDDQDRTREGMPMLLYEYAVYFGYTNDDFGEWLGS